MLRVGGNVTVLSRHEYAVETDLLYRARVVVQRRTNTSDPSNDSVEGIVRWLGQNGEPLGGADGEAVIHLWDNLYASDGRQSWTLLFSRTAGLGESVVAPVAAVKAQVGVRFNGTKPRTDFEHASIKAVEVVYSPDVSTFNSRVTALEGIDAGARLTVLEGVIGEDAYQFDTVSDLEAATVAAPVQWVVCVRNDASGPIIRQVLHRTGSDLHPLTWQSTDGAYWEERGRDITPFHGGAVGDNELVDDTLPMQATWDYLEYRGGGRCSLAGATFRVSQQPGTGGVTQVSSPDGDCLIARDNVRVCGPGRIAALAAHSWTGSGSFVSSEATGASFFGLFDLEIDGSDLTDGFISGATLVNSDNCSYIGNYVHDTSSLGLSFTFDLHNYSTPQCFFNRTERNRIKSTRNIPLHAAGNLGWLCVGNIVDNRDVEPELEVPSSAVFGDWRGGNGVGFFGDDYQTEGTLSTAFDSLVADNLIFGAWYGLFAESSSRVTFANNRVTGILEGYSGMYINTSHAFATNVKVIGNYFEAKEGERGYGGVECKLGRRCDIAGNYFKGFTHGMVFRNGASDFNIGVNDFEDISSYIILPERGTNMLTRSDIAQQRYHGEPVSSWPKACYPIDEPNGNARYFKVRMAGVLGLYDRELLPARLNGGINKSVYADGTGGKPAWSAYAIYSGGETIVYVDTAMDLPAVGGYIRKGSTYYLVHARTGGQVTIRSVADAAGDYTGNANSSARIQVYSATEFGYVTTH